MIYCTYSTETNALLGVSSSEPTLSPGQAVIAHNRAMPDFVMEEWNPSLLNFFTKQGITISKLEYLRRFTGEERITIRTASKSNVVLEDYLAMLDLALDVALSDPDTIAAVNMLEAVGLIAQGRAAEILA